MLDTLARRTLNILVAVLFLVACGEAVPTQTADFRRDADMAAEATRSTEVMPTPTPSRTARATRVPTGTPTAVPPAQPTVTVQVEVVAGYSSVSLREGPGAGFAVIGYLYEGDVVPVLEQSQDGTWFRVAASDGREGWVALSVVEVLGEFAEETAAQTAHTPTPDSQPDSGAAAAPTTLATGSPTAVPPLYVVVENTSDQADSLNNLWIYGEVANPGRLPARSIELTATLYDASGSVAAVGSSYADMPLSLSLWFTGVLYPGERAPFNILIDEPGEWADWKLTVTYEQARETSYESHYTALEVQNDSGRAVNDFLGNYRVSGEIVNTGDGECGPVRVVVTAYNEAGQVVGSNMAHSEFDALAPGAVTPFSVTLNAREPVASYAIIMRAILAD